MLRSGYWQSLTTIDFAELDVERTVAVLPVGAVEQHGPHLPLATDSAINAGIVAATLPRLGDDVCALVLPAASVGHSIEHEDYRGTLSIAAENLLRVWLDLGRNVATAGIRKLVIFNTHGGQRALVELAAVRLRVEHAMLVARTSYTVFGAPEGLFSADEWRHGIHGGEIETSLMLHLHPELVRLDALRDFENRAAAATGDRKSVV